MAKEMNIPGNLLAQLQVIYHGHTSGTDLLSFNDGSDMGIHISDIGLNARLIEHFEIVNAGDSWAMPEVSSMSILNPQL
ncbi:MAG: hypothetical protein U5L96_05180 [Owenweeksia sp.]|nr:hypothetical protein [Owenweeksia sp.]